MIHRCTLLVILLFSCLLSSIVAQAQPYDPNTADLIQVYQQALVSDPTYQQAIAQQLYDKQGVPINVSALLPALSFQGAPSISKSQYTGNTVQPVSNTTKQYILNLNLTQTVFNMAQFMAVAEARSLSKQADATLNAATQDLMTRVASAYFAVLQDEDNIAYADAAKMFYGKQLEQIKQQYAVGLKTVTDVYTSRASFESASANYIAAVNQFAMYKENLRVITGTYYPKLAKLSDTFPLISPQPANIEAWVKKSIQQNWSIKAAQYAADAALQNVKQQFSGHLPTINIAGTMSNTYVTNTGDSVVLDEGSSRQINRAATINLNIPLFQGGYVTATTQQAQYAYQKSLQGLEQATRMAINMTRQSYLSIIASISQIIADKQAIKSATSSVQGLEASYQVGTGTLIDVLNVRQALLNNEKEYAADRYSYVNNLLALKKAAGTLSTSDLQAINSWLETSAKSAPHLKPHKM